MPSNSTYRIPAGIEATENVRALFMRYGARYRWLATITSILGTFATLLTATIINVAIPDVMGAFGMTPDEAQWLSTGYLASSTIGMLLAAWLIETYGMARTYHISMIIFLVGSALGGVATSSDLVIVGRIIQGAGSGLIMPMSMLVIFQVSPVHRRGTAMGIYSVGVVLAPAIAPALGGWLIDNFSWRYVFFVSIPFAVASFPLAALFMPARETDSRSPSFDWVGVILLTIFLTALLVTFSNGQKEGWNSDFIATSGFIAVISGIAFIYREAYAADPMFNLRLFANTRFLAASVVTFVVGAGLYGSTYLVPLFMQTLQGRIPTDAGVILIPGGLMMAVAFPIAGRLSDGYPPRILIAFGLFAFGISSWLFRGIDINTPAFNLILWLVIGRIGLALVFPALNAASLRALPLDQLAQGSGAINFLRQLGGTFGVNVLAVYLQQRTSIHVGALAVSQTPNHVETLETLQRVAPILHSAGLSDAYATLGGFHFLGRIVYSQGNMLAYRDSFVLVAVVFFLCLIPTWFMDKRSPERV